MLNKPTTMDKLGLQPAQSEMETKLREYCLAIMQGLELELRAKDLEHPERAILVMNKHRDWIACEQLKAFNHGAAVHDVVRWMAREIKSSPETEQKPRN